MIIIRARNKVRKGDGELMATAMGVIKGRNLIARVKGSQPDSASRGRNLIARVEGWQLDSPGGPVTAIGTWD